MYLEVTAALGQLFNNRDVRSSSPPPLSQYCFSVTMLAIGIHYKDNVETRFWPNSGRGGLRDKESLPHIAHPVRGLRTEGNLELFHGF